MRGGPCVRHRRIAKDRAGRGVRQRIMHRRGVAVY